ncbi:MAG TPA: hypothetical protein VJT73_14750 [Polyangiaceae bacterium]|nr:hypothetical protein [Polyangiaceae bacterium]
MIFCPRCGSPAAPESLVCGVCGATLQAVPGSEPRGQATGGSPMKKTLMGMAKAANAPAPMSGGLKKTMLGMPATQPARPPAPSDPQEAGKQTIIGLPSPMADTPPLSNPVPFAPAAPERAAIPAHKKTVLGVAMPGIAPLAPGVPKEPERSPVAAYAPQAVGPSPTTTAWSPSAPTPSWHPEPTSHPRVLARSEPRARTSNRSAAIAIVGGLVLAGGAVAFAFLWRSPPPLRAEARAETSGTDLLHITCATCPDGTELRVGAASAKVAARAADLALAAPLQIGENRFSVDIDRPGNGRDEKVALSVRIGYRIRPDLSRLEADKPMLRVAVEGAPGGEMQIDGKALKLGPDGKGNYDVDISPECTGLADETKTVERAIPYSVIGTSGAPEKGTVNIRVAVVPLHVDAPGAYTVVAVDRFLLAGRTSRGARLAAHGQAVPVAADGSFSRPVPLPVLGESSVELRASAPGQAPRSARVKIKRVVQLADEARDFAAKAPLSFADLTTDVNQHIGEPIVIVGEVAEGRSQGARALALVDVQKGCSRSPCLARIALPSEDALVRGDRVQVYGHVARAITPKSDTGGAVPEIEAAFTIKKR